MALDRDQSSFATFQPHANAKFSTGNNGSGVWPFCMPGASVQTQDTGSYMSWSTSAEDGPYHLISGVQNGWISRKPANVSGCDGETDLQSLVSNILDEAVLQDGYNGRARPASNSIWAPKSVSDEQQQGVQLPSRTQRLTAFHPNFAPSVTSNAAIPDDKDVFQPPEEPVMSQQWILNIPKTDQDYLTNRPPKLPPGLPVPNTSNAYQSQMQKERHETTTVNEKRGNKNYSDSFLDLSHVFNPPSEATTPYFHSHSEDNVYNGAKPISNQQYDSQDPSQLLAGFQSFMAREHEVSFHGNFADVYRETQSRRDEERMGEHWKFTSPSVPTHLTPAAQTTKEWLGGQMERNGVMRNEMVHCEGIQSLHGLSGPNTEPFQQPKMFSGSVGLANHYQTKTTVQKQNNLLPFNLKNKQCSNQQEHIQGKIKSQLQKETARMSGIRGGNLYASHIANCGPRGREQSQQILDHFEIMQSQRFGGEPGRASAVDAQQPTFCVYPANDPNRHWSANASNYHSRSTLSHGNPDPSVLMGNVMSACEFTAVNAVGSDLMSHRGDPTCPGRNSAVGHVPVVQLYLDDCCHQLKCLEKERKQTEIILTKASQGGTTAAKTSTFLPRMPPNPTRIDHLIVSQIQEQAKVAGVLHSMESSNSFLHVNIHTALKTHYLAISVTEARRNEDVALLSQQRQQQQQQPQQPQPGDYFAAYKDALLMAVALRDLTAATKRLRSALWCALQMALPQAVLSQRPATAAGAGRCASPDEGGSFEL